MKNFRQLNDSTLKTWSKVCNKIFSYAALYQRKLTLNIRGAGTRLIMSVINRFCYRLISLLVFAFRNILNEINCFVSILLHYSSCYEQSVFINLLAWLRITTANQQIFKVHFLENGAAEEKILFHIFCSIFRAELTCSVLQLIIGHVALTLGFEVIQSDFKTIKLSK